MGQRSGMEGATHLVVVDVLLSMKTGPGAGLAAGPVLLGGCQQASSIVLPGDDPDDISGAAQHPGLLGWI